MYLALLLTLLTFIPSAFSKVHVASVPTGTITIDGVADDWRSISRFRAGHRIKGIFPDNKDFSATAAWTLSGRWLYFLAEIEDDVRVKQRLGDEVRFAFKVGTQTHMLRIPLPSADDSNLKVYRDYKRKSNCTGKAKIKEQRTTIEFRCPLNLFPKIKRSESGVAATFFDVDARRSEAEAVLSTHVVDAKLYPIRATFFFGDEHVKYTVYERSHEPLKAKLEQRLPWIKGTEVQLIITESALVYFGDELPNDLPYLRVIHGWNPSFKQVDVRQYMVKGEPYPSLIINYVVNHNQVSLKYYELYGINAGSLRLRFSQLVEVKFPDGQMVKTLPKLSKNGKRIIIPKVTLSKAQKEELELFQLKPNQHILSTKNERYTITRQGYLSVD